MILAILCGLLLVPFVLLVRRRIRRRNGHHEIVYNVPPIAGRIKHTRRSQTL